MLGVILAAGRGTRMRGLTADRPKAMLPVVGKPIIARVADQLQEAGVSGVLIVVAGDDRHIRPYFEAHPPQGISLRFAVQQQAGGMAHALLQAAPYIDQPFILTACDSLYPDGYYSQLVQAHQADDCPATLALMKVPPEVVVRAGIADIADGRVVRVVEKPTLEEAPSDIASLALYVFDPALLGYLGQVEKSSRGELELQDAIQLMIDEVGSLTGILTPWRLEMTAPPDLLEVNLRALRANPSLAVLPPDCACQITPPVYIEPGVFVPNDAILGPNVYLEAGAQLGRGVTLHNCIVLHDGFVGDGQTIDSVLVSAATEI